MLGSPEFLTRLKEYHDSDHAEDDQAYTGDQHRQ